MRRLNYFLVPALVVTVTWAGCVSQSRYTELLREHRQAMRELETPKYPRTTRDKQIQGENQKAEPDSKRRSPPASASEPKRDSDPTVEPGPNEWAWRARIDSVPPGADIYCTSDEDHRRHLGRTPLTVTIYTMGLKGRPGTRGEVVHTYILPTLRTDKGFICRFEVVRGHAKKKVYAFWDHALGEDTGEQSSGGMHLGRGLVADLRQGKAVLFKPGHFIVPQSIPSGYEFPRNRVSPLSVEFESPKP